MSKVSESWSIKLRLWIRSCQFKSSGITTSAWSHCIAWSAMNRHPVEFQQIDWAVFETKQRVRLAIRGTFWAHRLANCDPVAIHRRFSWILLTNAWTLGPQPSEYFSLELNQWSSQESTKNHKDPKLQSCKVQFYTHMTPFHFQLLLLKTLNYSAEWRVRGPVMQRRHEGHAHSFISVVSSFNENKFNFKGTQMFMLYYG